MQKKECKKVKFIDEVAAMFYISKLKRTSMRDKTPLRAYLCPFCTSWHLTSRPDFNKTKEQEKQAENEQKNKRHSNQLEDRDNQIKNLKKKLQTAYDRNYELNQKVMAYEKMLREHALNAPK